MTIIIAAIILAFGIIVGAELAGEAVERTGKELGHEIHILAETFCEIKHCGIGIDTKEQKEIRRGA